MNLNPFGNHRYPAPAGAVTTTTDQPVFRGYPPDALELLAALGTHDRVWFGDHHDQYVAAIAEPTRLLVTSLGGLLHESVSEGLQAIPRVNGSIAPVATDRRFATTRDLPPYRDSILLRFWEGPEKPAAATLHVRIAPHSVEFAAARSFAGKTLAGYRQAVAGEDGAVLAEVLAAVQRRHDAVLDGRHLKRVPTPFPPDHPRMDLLRHTRLLVRWSEPVPKAIGSARFAKWCERRLVDLADVHRWLRDCV